MSELLKRVFIAAVLIPIVLAAIYFGKVYLFILLAIVGILSSYEYIRMFQNINIRIGWHWLILSSTVFYVLSMFRNSSLLVIWILLFIAIIDALIRWDQEKSLPRVAFAVLGVVVTGFLPAMIYRLGNTMQQPNRLLWLVGLIWLTDSTAYFAGKALGRNRNITPVSPNKSLEGFIAGVLAPFILVIILYYVKVLSDLPEMLVIAFAAGVIGQIGDLAESMLKRFCKVKDSSGLIPGHGGILDRCDSVLLAGSFLNCAILILEKVR
jgi:phosphatidate cytidylyltransferase